MNKAIFPLLLLLLAGCGDTNTIKIVRAEAVIYSVSSADQITFTAGETIGSATLMYNYNFTTLEITVSGMTPNSSHAMHLHMGSLETPTHHWNQGGTDSFCNELSQGAKWNKPFAGDIGNIEIDENGEGYFKLSTDLWSLNTNKETDVLGTVIFFHENAEFFSASCTNGRVDKILHANPKIAAGTIQQAGK